MEEKVFEEQLEWENLCDKEMPGIRETHKEMAEKGELHGCGLHRNFSYDDIATVEQSLKQCRILAGPPTKDVIDYWKKYGEFMYKDACSGLIMPHSTEMVVKELKKKNKIKALKEKLRNQIIKELLEDFELVPRTTVSQSQQNQ